MDYPAQQRFFERYRSIWLLCALPLAAALIDRVRSINLAELVLVICGIAIFLALGYLPKYLHMHREPEKRYAWSVRVRWILIATGAVVALVFAGTTHLRVIFVATAWL